jgi:hypothetical protein
MASRQEGSKLLARALAETVARASELEPTALVAALDKIEEAFLPQVSKSPKLQLETKRRVAEWKFKLLSERDMPLEVVGNLREDIRKLGYTNLETEGTIELYFAQYCIRQSRTSDAKKTLLGLCEKLGEALKDKDLLVYRHLKQVSEEILAGL